MAQYELPGLRTVFKPQTVGVDSSQGTRTGKSLTLIGTATDGPSWIPIPLSRKDAALDLFGVYYDAEGLPNGATLVRGFNEAIDAGARNVHLFRIGGKYAVGVIGDDAATPTETYLILKGKYPGDKYNVVKYQIADNKLKIWNVNDATAGKATPSAQYTLANYPTMARLVDTINKESLLSDVIAEVGPQGATKVPSTLEAMVAPATLTGGDNQLDLPLGEYTDAFDEEGYPTSLRGALNYAYNLLRDYKTDKVVPLGVYVTLDGSGTLDTTDSQRLADYCYESSLWEHDVTGVISFGPLTDTSIAGVEQFVNEMSLVTHEYKLQDGTNMDIGYLISVTLGEALFSDTKIGSYYGPFSVSYAAFSTTLPLTQGTTNQTIPNIRGVKYSFGPEQLSILTQKKFVTLRANMDRNRIVVTEGIVASTPSCDFQHLSGVEVMHSVARGIRAVTDPYIGRLLDLPTVNSLCTAIKTVLDAHVEQGALIEASFTPSFDTTSNVIGEMLISLELVIPDELVRVRAEIHRRRGSINTQRTS